MARLSRLRLAGLLMTLLAGPCLAQQFPSRLMLQTIPLAASSARYASLAY